MEVFENEGSASLCGRVKTEVFENGGSASLCGRAKSEVFENDYVTGIGMSQLKKQNGCFLIRFRWCSVDGRKRYKNASVDEKLFIRFQEKENGGFRKRISVATLFEILAPTQLQKEFFSSTIVIFFSIIDQMKTPSSTVISHRDFMKVESVPSIPLALEQKLFLLTKF